MISMDLFYSVVQVHITINLCLLLIFSFLCNANVVQANETIQKDEKINAIEELLSTIDLQKNLFELSDVDFSKLYLGNQIPAYCVLENGTVDESEILIYPLIYNNEWVATIDVYYDTNNNLIAQISRDYIETVNDNRINISAGIGLLFDNKNAYIYSDNNYYSVKGTYSYVCGRGSIESINATNRIDTIPIEIMYQLNVEKPLNIQQDRSLMISSKALWVPSVVQSLTNSCWAASTASILSYLTGTTYSESTVMSYCGYDTSSDPGMSASSVKSHLIYTFSRSVTQYQNSSIFYPNFTWNVLKSQIGNYHPIFTACTSSYAGHAVVTQGYVENITSSNYGTISFMDPSNGTYRASLVPLDETFSMTTTGGDQL